MKIKCALAGVALAAAMLSCGPAVAASKFSATYQANLAHDGTLQFKKTFKPPFKAKWTRDLDGVVSYPIVVNGLVFVTVGNSGDQHGAHFYALDLKTGATVWEKLLDGLWQWANASYDDGRIFVVSSAGTLQAFTADRAGSLLWMHKQKLVLQPPLADQGQVFLDGDNTWVYGMDAATGALNWKREVDGGSGSQPTIGDHGLYVAFPCKYYKLSTLNGAIRWLTDLGCDGGGGNTVVYYNKKAYVRDWTRDGSVLNSANGQITASFKDEQPPVLWQQKGGKLLYFSVQKKTLYAYDASTGAKVWQFGGTGGVEMASAPFLVNDYLFEGSAGTLYALNPATGDVLWSTPTHSTLVGTEEGQNWAPWTGFGGGDGVLVVPAGNLLTAFVPEGGK